MSFDILEFANAHHGNDFYNFINESWLNKVEIPDDYQRWGTFQELEKNNFLKIKKLLEDDNQFKNENFKKVILLYHQLNNINMRTSKENFVKIKNMIDKINKAESYQSLFSLMIEFDLEFGLNCPITFSVQSSFKNAELNILHLSSGGLGLPDRDYYFLESKQQIREKYIEFIKNYGSFFGVELNSPEIFILEKKIADKTLTQVQKRNTELTNNLTNFDFFISQNKNLKYLYKIFETANKKPGQINVTNTEFMSNLNTLIESTDLNLWKQYFVFHLILEFNFCLSIEIETEYFNFYNKVLKGTKTMKPLWKRSIENLNSLVGELVGLEYSNKFFKPAAKLLAEEIVNLIKEELRDYLTSNDWMEPDTKKRAILKLEKMKIKIGYPEIISKNYSELNILQTNTLVENIINAKNFDIKYELASLYENLDRNKWFMNAHSVNAYYSPNMNEIVFPAGILQEPFFSVNQDMAYNFGGFGMVIGHEITHGFDDEGSKYDAYGNLNNWWNPNDFKKYNLMTQQIVNQYNNYQIEGNNVNGNLTLGENIADIGGLALSLRAFKKYNQCLKNTSRIKINYSNLTDEQKFFMNFANIWKSKGRSEDIQQRILLDVHSPPIFRVNGSVRNINEFYEAFNIKSTDKLYLKPEDRVRIWG